MGSTSREIDVFLPESSSRKSSKRLLRFWQIWEQIYIIYNIYAKSSNFSKFICIVYQFLAEPSLSLNSQYQNQGLLFHSAHFPQSFSRYLQYSHLHIYRTAIQINQGSSEDSILCLLQPLLYPQISHQKLLLVLKTLPIQRQESSSRQLLPPDSADPLHQMIVGAFSHVLHLGPENSLERRVSEIFFALLMAGEKVIRPFQNPHHLVLSDTTIISEVFSLQTLGICWSFLGPR